MKAIETPAKIGIKKVLFPTDFSSAADAAIPYTTEIVRRFGAQLYALHVRPPVINPMTEPAAWPALEKAAKAEADAQNQALRATFPGIKPEVLIEEGDLWKILKIGHREAGNRFNCARNTRPIRRGQVFPGLAGGGNFPPGPLRGVDDWPACARETTARW